MSRPILLALAAMAALAACRADLTVDAGVAVRCAANADCPPGTLCNPNTSLCADADHPDFTPPSLTSTSVEPAVARLGSVVTVRLAADEPLAAPPVVELAGVGTPRTFTAVSGTAGDVDFVFELMPAPGDAEGVAYHVGVSFTDLAGNPAQAELSDTVRFDFTGAAPVGLTMRLVPKRGTPLGVVDTRLGGNLLRDLAVAGPGTDVMVSFELSEAVRDPATQVAVSAVPAAGAAVAFTLRDVVNDRLTFTHTIADEAEGDWAIVVSTTDDVGNLREESTLVLTIDRSAPPQAAVDTSDLVVYERIPWGAAATGGEPTFRIVAGAGAAAGAAFVLALDRPAFGGSAIGAAAVANGGGFSITLDQGDRRDVFLMTLDAAGNSLDPVRVRDTHLVSTLGFKEAGSRAENPNVMGSTPRFDATLEQPAAREIDAASGVATADCPSSCATGVLNTRGIGYWKPRSSNDPSGSPPVSFTPVDYMATGYDPVSSRVIVFGGFVAGQPSYNATWAFDGTGWTRVTTAGPSGRRGARMTVDENLGRLILFGGQYTVLDTACAGGNFFCNDVWQWNGSSWTALATAGGPPAQRSGHAMTFDRRRDRTVVYGGDSASGKLGDTWELNCSVAPCAWTQLLSAGPTPARAEHAMVYSPTLGMSIVFGGATATATLSDMWQRDLTAWSVAAASVGPGSAGHSLLFDTSRAELLSWGLPHGTDTSATDCQRPVTVSPAGLGCPEFLFGPAPAQTGDSYAVYDAARSDVVVFSRIFDPGYTYRWNGGAGDKPAHFLHVALGDALGGSSAALVADVDFTSPLAPDVPGMQRDIGDAYGVRDSHGRTYGWTCTKLNPGYAGAMPRQEMAAEPDTPPAWASYILAQYAFQLNADYSCSWDYALQSGQYVVLTWLRDAGTYSDAAAMDVEGQTFVVNKGTAGRLAAFARLIDVSDGQLTLTPVDPDPGDGYDPLCAVAAVAIYRVTTLDALTVRWTAGSASTVSSTSLLGWDGVAWNVLTTGGGTIAAPAELTWTAPSSAAAAVLVQGPHRTLSFAIAPSGYSGARANGAEIVTDYVEVETRFRLVP